MGKALVAAAVAALILTGCQQPSAEQVRAQQLRAEIYTYATRPCAIDFAQLTRRDPGSSMFGWSIERIVARMEAEPNLYESRWKIESNILRVVYDMPSYSDRLAIYEAHKSICREANREVVPGASTEATPEPSRVHIGIDCAPGVDANGDVVAYAVSLPDDMLTECE